jgi:hypothetical protein
MPPSPPPYLFNGIGAAANIFSNDFGSYAICFRYYRFSTAVARSQETALNGSDERRT